jgi:predicted tellurium resistance membrane protein TerC
MPFIELAHEETAVDAVIALVTLSLMEIVLGIDNLIFIAILTARLPKEQQKRARQLGLLGALGTRIILLMSLTYVMQLDKPLFYLSPLLDAVGAPSDWLKDDAHAAHDRDEQEESDAPADGEVRHSAADGISIKDLILLGGGLFLLGKSVLEIHHKVEGGSEHQGPPRAAARFTAVLIQVALFDLLFSLDSVITAIGMARADQLWVMITAVIIAVAVMLIFANPVSNFVEKHPTITILALSFLILIGVMLVAEGLGQHINKGYIYFAMAFSLVVEFLNMRVRKHVPPTAAAKPAGSA